MQGYGWALLLELSGESRYSPVNASTTASRPPPHDSGPEWIAAPILYRTFIDYPSPVSLAHYASGPTHLALIHVDVSHSTILAWCIAWSGALAGRRRAGRTAAPRNSGDAHRPTGTEIPMAILVAFDKHYFEAHVPIAKKIPGLRKSEVSRGPV